MTCQSDCGNNGSIMEEILKNIWAIMVVVLSSSVIAALVNNFVTGYRDRRMKRKELVAKANASILKRVELCYRIRRRAKDEDIVIKNLTHDVQEENEYYKSLLLVESKWYGERYSLYLESIRKLTSGAMSKAWQTDGNPAAVVEDGIKLDYKKIKALSNQFSLDSRHFLCPIRRLWMTVHDKFCKVEEYHV